MATVQTQGLIHSLNGFPNSAIRPYVSSPAPLNAYPKDSSLHQSSESLIKAFASLKMEAARPPSSPPLIGRATSTDPSLEEKRVLCKLLKQVRPDPLDPQPTNVAKMAEDWEATNFQDMEKLQKLKHLHFSCQDLTEIPASIRLLTGLVKLNLRGNKLKSLPDELEALPRLRILQLDDNLLEQIPPVVVRLAKAKQLHTLTLDRNDHLRRVETSVSRIHIFGPPNEYFVYIDD